jgi:tetratricopeptide (TPR) repeat protein
VLLVRSRALTALGLVLLTAAIYGQTGTFGSLSWDDKAYVFENRTVLGGLSWGALRWAFTTFFQTNWHPLTWLAYLTEVSWLGPSAGPIHLVGAALHAIDSVLLFLVLDRLTRQRGRAAAVAALFCVHPVHVESVAWISEQKDTLSTLFGLLSLASWVGWVERRSVACWLGAVVAFAASLMCKPMLVTWPFLLLLLDVWPLGRLRLSRPALHGVDVGRLALEKLPFFALSLASSIVTMRAQASAIMSLTAVLLPEQLANVLDNYARYLGLLLWPTDLALFYPVERSYLAARAVAAAMLLSALTFFAVRSAHRTPALAVGWLWFLGMLVPVIGLVQVGQQSIADHYMYLPSVGALIVLVWGAGELAVGRRCGRALPAATLLAVLLLTALAHRQTSFWRDNETLSRHALEVTTDNYTAMHLLALDLYQRRQDPAEVAELFAESARLQPYDADTHWGLAATLRRLGRPQESLDELWRAHRLAPGNTELCFDLAFSLLEADRVAESIDRFEYGLRIVPEEPAARLGLAQALEAAGRRAEALHEVLEVERAAAGTPLGEQARLAAARLR